MLKSTQQVMAKRRRAMRRSAIKLHRGRACHETLGLPDGRQIVLTTVDTGRLRVRYQTAA